MAIAQIGSIGAWGEHSVGGAVQTRSFTVPSGADALWVSVGASAYAGAPTISSVTSNGVSLTAVTNTEGTSADTGASSRIQDFILPAPTVGTYDIVVTFSGTNNGSTITACCFSGVDQTTPTEGGQVASGASGTSHALAPTTTTVNGDALCGNLLSDQGANTCTDSAVINADDYNLETWGISATYSAGYALTSGSGNTLDFSTPANTDWVGSVFVLKQASAGVTGSPIYAYMQQ